MSKRSRRAWFATTLALVCSFLGVAVSPAQAATVLIDFGVSDRQTTSANDPLGRTWNNFTTNGSKALNLTTGGSSGWSFNTSGIFNGTPNGNATAAIAGSPADLLGYPSTATNDSIYRDAANFNVSPAMILSGLSLAEKYRFTVFANRNSGTTSGVPHDRSGEYTFSNGVDSQTVTLNAAGNEIGLVATTPESGLAPSASGEIFVTLKRAPSSNQDFVYLSVLEVNTVPEPTSVALLGLGGVGFLAIAWRRRRARRSRG